MIGNDKLARYRTIAPLGTGGMASVVLGEDTLLGRRVALKRMHASGADPRGLLRLRREALVGASMSHRNLVSIYDVIDSADGDFVIVMEYVHGETLRDALSREGRLAPREAVRVLGGVAGGLDAIHARGIVHRDVKPANVLLGSDGVVKLADLGIASVPDHTRITTAGSVLGSFRYMAPEQLREGPASRAIDIYALAAVAFEVLSGRQARREPNPMALAHAIATQPPPDLREIWPAAPKAAAEVLMRGMCRDPEGRPTSAGELVADLGAAFETDDTASLLASAIGARGARAAAAGAGAVAPGQAALARERASGGRPVANAAAGSASAAQPALAAARPRTTAARVSGAARPSRDQPASTGLRSRGPVTVAEPRKTFRTGRTAARARVLAPLALVLVASGLVLALLHSGGSSSTGSRHPHASGPTGSRAGSRSAAHSRMGHSADRSSSSTASGTAMTTPAAGSAQTTASSGAAAGSGASSGAETGSSGASAETVAPSAPVSAPSSPAAMVQSFYHLAAAHRYGEAWALADPTFRTQLDGYAAFQSELAADRSITFDAARILRQTATTATVYVQTTSVRTTGTEHCSGTVQLVRGGTSGGWLLHMISINCT